MGKKLHIPAAVILSLLIIAAFAVPVSAGEELPDADNTSYAAGFPFDLPMLKASKGKKDKIVVKSVEYDRKSRTVTFEFKGSVKWKSPKVKITRKDKNFAKKIQGKDSHSLVVKVKKLTYGATYSYKISGVKNKKGKKYQTVKGTFTAEDK